MKLILLLLLASGCKYVGPYEEPQPKPDPTPDPPEKSSPGLPAGFAVSGGTTVEPAFLGPADTWRQLKSRLTTVQADARRRGKGLMVSFEPSAVHVTRQDGSRTTWQLPNGLALTVEIPHVLVRADLTLEGFVTDGSQVPSEEELTIAIVTVTEDGAGTREFRLVVKGGTTFRSISSG
ncbi:MAG: hypothetical protein ACYS0E_19200 [Planctomycetota bacterium]|jgi:hypothetical protein